MHFNIELYLPLCALVAANPLHYLTGRGFVSSPGETNKTSISAPTGQPPSNSTNTTVAAASNDHNVTTVESTNGTAVGSGITTSTNNTVEEPPKRIPRNLITRLFRREFVISTGGTNISVLLPASPHTSVNSTNATAANSSNTTTSTVEGLKNDTSLNTSTTEPPKHLPNNVLTNIFRRIIAATLQHDTTLTPSENTTTNNTIVISTSNGTDITVVPFTNGTNTTTETSSHNETRTTLTLELPQPFPRTTAPKHPKSTPNPPTTLLRRSVAAFVDHASSNSDTTTTTTSHTRSHHHSTTPTTTTHHHTTTKTEQFPIVIATVVQGPDGQGEAVAKAGAVGGNGGNGGVAVAGGNGGAGAVAGANGHGVTVGTFEVVETGTPEVGR